MTVVPKQNMTAAKITTLVLANMEAPIRQTIKFSVFKAVQYKNLYQLLSGNQYDPSPTKNPKKNSSVSETFLFCFC